MSALRKDENLNVRMDSKTLEMVKHAASISGKSLTAFVTEAAMYEAQKELLDQRFLGVDAAVFDEISEVLDKPGVANPNLVALMKKQNEWID